MLDFIKDFFSTNVPLKPKYGPNNPPRLASEALHMAMNDLAKVERDDLYRVHMGTWHGPTDDNDPTCFVCLAGSVMAKTLGSLPEHGVCPSDLGDDVATWPKVLRALNALRTGDALEAY